jgi:predicted nucleic-acid-binding Zn-ribbon protein
MVQVELSNMYINICAKASVNSYEQKSTATSGKVIQAVYAWYGYVYIHVLCTG